MYLKTFTILDFFKLGYTTTNLSESRTDTRTDKLNNEQKSYSAGPGAARKSESLLKLDQEPLEDLSQF